MKNNYKGKNLDANVKLDKEKVKDNNFVKIESQYSTLILLVFKVLFTNLTSLLVKNVYSFKSKVVDYSFKKFFIANTTKKRLKYYCVKPAVRT